MTYKLDELDIYKELTERRNREKASQYAVFLQLISGALTVFLEYNKNNFPEYPDHGIQHSYRILNYIYCILDDKVIKNMSDTELFCLIMAALFHDTGMALYTKENVEQIRKAHHLYAAEVLDDYFDRYLQILGEAGRIKAAIQFACESHGMDIRDVYNSHTYKITDTIDGERVRYRVLASLLRIGDLMDLEGIRVNEFVLSCFGASFSETSREHNIRHLRVTRYDYPRKEPGAHRNEFVVCVFADNVEQYRIWSQWLAYMGDEIVYINSYLKDDGIYIPNLEKKIEKPEEADFDVEDIRFEIDDSGNMWKLLSQSVYTNEFDFLRELVQNAIDATLYKSYVDSAVKLGHISPRSWKRDTYIQDVFVGYSQENKELYVIDSGIGMNKSDLKDFLFKVAGSGYSKAKDRNFQFPGIAKFGIGFVSCLIIASDIEIFTKKSDDKEMYHVSLIANNNQAIIEHKESEVVEGTIIHLRLKEDFKYDRIVQYLKDTFLYPSVGILCVDIDCMKQMSKSFNMEKVFERALKKPFELRKCYHKLEEKSKEKAEPYINKERLYSDILSHVDQLVNLLKYSRISKVKYVSWPEYTDVYNMVCSLESKINKHWENEFCKFPFLAETIEQNSDTDINEYLLQLSEFKSAVKTLKAEATCEQNALNIQRYQIQTADVSMGFKWKYCICEFDENFMIENIRYEQKAVNLAGKTGLLFLYHEKSDYDAGYEYAALNGFLFHNGIVCNYITRMVGYYERAITGERSVKVNIQGYAEEPEFDRDILDELYDQDMANDEYLAPCDGFTVEPSYKKVYIDNNHIVIMETSPEENELHNFTRGNDPVAYLSMDSKYFNKISMETDADLDDFEKMIGFGSYVFCQDGISLNNNCRGLFPVGFFKINCNLTANARMKLNISRHEISKIWTDIDPWVKDTALKIQKSIISQVMEALYAVSLDIDFKEMLQESKITVGVPFNMLQQFKCEVENASK